MVLVLAEAATRCLLKVMTTEPGICWLLVKTVPLAGLMLVTRTGARSLPAQQHNWTCSWITAVLKILRRTAALSTADCASTAPSVPGSATCARTTHGSLGHGGHCAR